MRPGCHDQYAQRRDFHHALREHLGDHISRCELAFDVDEPRGGVNGGFEEADDFTDLISSRLSNLCACDACWNSACADCDRVRPPFARRSREAYDCEPLPCDFGQSTCDLALDHALDVMKR